MAKKDRKYKVEIDLSGPNPVPRLKTNNNQPIPPSEPIIFNKDADGMKKVDHYRIRFELDNPNHSNLRFIQNRDDVLWVHGDVQICPTSPCAMPGVFWVDEIDTDGKWIDVINMDLVVEQFRFTLNFADKNIANPTPADYVPLDPIGENEDRGSFGSEYQMSLATAVTVGAVAGLVAFAAAETFLPAW